MAKKAVIHSGHASKTSSVVTIMDQKFFKSGTFLLAILYQTLVILTVFSENLKRIHVDMCSASLAIDYEPHFVLF